MFQQPTKNDDELLEHMRLRTLERWTTLSENQKKKFKLLAPEIFGEL